MKNSRNTELFFIAVAVLLYKVVTLNIIGGNCCTLQTNYFPSIGEVNVLVGLITLGNILGGAYLANKYLKKHVFFGVIGFSYLLSIVNEGIIQALGLRVYSGEVNSLLSGPAFLGIHFETYAYILVGVVFMVSIYEYLARSIGEKSYENYDVNFKNYFKFSVLAALMTEILVHPQSVYSGFPGFTNLFQDINWVVILILGTLVSLSMYLPDAYLKKNKVELEWYVRGTVYVGFASLLYFVYFVVLANLGMYQFLSGGLMWGIDIFGLPIEALSSIVLVNIFNVMFVRRHSAD
jgi:hypothetical protein